MVQAVASTEAIEKRYEGPNGTFVNRYYINADYRNGPKEVREGACAFLVALVTPSGKIRPHFHAVDQFQVVVAGGGHMGNHGLHPISVHYTDAYTPYGPILAGPKGISFFTLRARTDGTSIYNMPESRHEIKGRSGREVIFETEVKAPETLYRNDVAVEQPFAPHNDGLAAWVIRAGPKMQVSAPSPKGGGQIALIVSGDAQHGEKQMPLWSCISLTPGDPPLHLTAGASGMEALILQFPTPREAI